MVRLFAAPGLGLALLLTAGCALFQDVAPPVPKTEAQAVFLGRTTLNSGLAAVKRYGDLPLCKPGAPPVCHQVGVLESAFEAGTIADRALTRAERVARDPAYKGQSDLGKAVAAGQAALEAFNDIVQTLPTK